MLKSGANVPPLDKPTHDLDVNTIRALEEALKTRRLCRHHQPRPLLLDRLATHIISLRRQLPSPFFEGNFQLTRKTNTKDRHPEATKRTDKYRKHHDVDDSRPF